MPLSFCVWVYMYIRRLGYIFGRQIDAQAIASPEQLNALLPEAVNRPSNNLKNLFELPVLFYALCALLLATQKADGLYVQLAWIYVALRTLHSLVHCTVNLVLPRFALYMASSVVLWGMLGRFALSAFAAG